MAQFENHHLGVFLYLNTPASPALFRLGVSVLGGSDVLGDTGTGKSWQNYQEHVTEINVDNTITLTGVNPEYTGLMIDLVLRFDTDLLADTGFSVGTWIKITLEDYVPSVSSEPIWYAKIKSFTKELDAYGTFIYTIHAEDVLQDVLATPVTDFTPVNLDGKQILDEAGVNLDANPLPVPDFTTNRLIQPEMAYGVNAYYWEDYELAVTDGTYADLVQPITQGAAVWWYNKGNDPVIYGIGHRELVSDLYRSPVVTFASDETDSRIAVDFINVSQNSTAIINDVLLSLAWDPATVEQYTNQDLIDLYGRNKQELSFDFVDNQGLIRYRNMILNANRPNVIKSLSCDAIIHKNRKLSDVWKLYPSSMVTVDITTPDVTIAQDYYVSGIKHTITPDGWTTTVELWKDNY